MELIRLEIKFLVKLLLKIIAPKKASNALASDEIFRSKKNDLAALKELFYQTLNLRILQNTFENVPKKIVMIVFKFKQNDLK